MKEKPHLHPGVAEAEALKRWRQPEGFKLKDIDQTAMPYEGIATLGRALPPKALGDTERL
jgi:hypothetical protein